MTVVSTVDVCLLCAVCGVCVCGVMCVVKYVMIGVWVCGEKREGGVNAGATRQGRKPEPHYACGE